MAPSDPAGRDRGRRAPGPRLPLGPAGGDRCEAMPPACVPAGHTGPRGFGRAGRAPRCRAGGPRRRARGGHPPRPRARCARGDSPSPGRAPPPGARSSGSRSSQFSSSASGAERRTPGRRGSRGPPRSTAARPASAAQPRPGPPAGRAPSPARTCRASVRSPRAVLGEPPPHVLPELAVQVKLPSASRRTRAGCRAATSAARRGPASPSMAASMPRVGAVRQRQDFQSPPRRSVAGRQNGLEHRRVRPAREGHVLGRPRDAPTEHAGELAEEDGMALRERLEALLVQA